MSENDIIKIDNNNKIKQSNRLIEARYNLTKYEQRMMIAICSQLNPNAEDFSKVRVKVKDMADFCHFEQNKAWNLVKATIMRLATRTLQIKSIDGSWYVTHWLQSARYIPSSSIIEYKIDEELKPELLQLKSAYLATPAEPLMEFSRDYSVRFYFILKKMLKIRDFEKDLDYFRDRFQLGQSYKIFFNLKNKVIEPALKEINEKSDISVWHEYIKEGRAYKKIHFIVELKQTDKKEIAPPAPKEQAEPPQITSSAVVSEPTETTEQSAGVALLQAIGINPPSASVTTANATEKKEEPAPAPAVAVAKNQTATDRGEGTEWTEEQQADYDRLLRYGVWTQTAKKYVIIYDHALIERNIQGCVKSNIKGNIKDLGAVIANAISNDTYKGEAEEQAKAREREQARKKAEYDAMIQHAKESEENRQAESDKNKKLAEIRVKKSRDELLAVFDNVMVEYNRNKILTPEMVAELEKNGIPQKDFISYTREITRKTIKYLQ